MEFGFIRVSMCMVERRGLGCVVVGRDLAKALSFCFFFAIVGRSCLGGGEVVLQCKGSNLIFLVGMDVGRNEFSFFWVGVIRLEKGWIDLCNGLVKIGWACWAVFYEFKLACTWPT